MDGCAVVPLLQMKTLRHGRLNTCLLSFNCNYNLAHPIIYYPGLSPGVEVQLPPSTLSPTSGVSPTRVSKTSVKGESEGDGLCVEAKGGSVIMRTLPWV